MKFTIEWTKLNEVVEESSEIKTFFFDIPENFTWIEGSFTHLALDGFNAGEKPNRNLVRHMSISTLPEEGKIGITTRIRKKRSEYKNRLDIMDIGDKVALFKTVSHVPLIRENKNIYLLSAGVGLATFRPLVLKYFETRNNINHIHSLNIDSEKEYLFTDVFETATDKNFTAQFVDQRKDYYKRVKQFSADKEGIFYIVGNDDFLIQNIELLLKQGISREQIMLDKRENQREKFFPTKQIV
jgi:ferredoxin-NADP reductase